MTVHFFIWTEAVCLWRDVRVLVYSVNPGITTRLFEVECGYPLDVARCWVLRCSSDRISLPLCSVRRSVVGKNLYQNGLEGHLLSSCWDLIAGKSVSSLKWKPSIPIVRKVNGNSWQFLKLDPQVNVFPFILKFPTMI